MHDDQLHTVQLLKRMGDSLHKKSPPEDDVEIVTPAFRKQVLDIFANNLRANNLRKLRKGDSGYTIESRADLEEATGMSKGMASRILGGAREDSTTKLIETSTYLGRIRKALGIPAAKLVAVRDERVDVVVWVAELDDKDFKIFREEYEREIKKLKR